MARAAAAAGSWLVLLRCCQTRPHCRSVSVGTRAGSEPPLQRGGQAAWFPEQNAARRLPLLAPCSSGCVSAAATGHGRWESSPGSGPVFKPQKRHYRVPDEAITGEAAGNPGRGVRLMHTTRS